MARMDWKDEPKGAIMKRNMKPKKIHILLPALTLSVIAVSVALQAPLAGQANDCVGKPYGTPGCPAKSSSSFSRSPTCGNAVVDNGEECDLGTARNGFSNCTKDCQALYCGDHLISPALKEECEPDYSEVYALDPATGELIVEVQYTAPSCGMICTVPSCDKSGECADGCKRMFLPACTSSASSTANAQAQVAGTFYAPTCSNGLIDAGEQCDDGNLVSFDACTNDCRIAFCGDGLMQIWEQCDDGNRIDSDACSNTCKLPACGDGVIQPGEECDDGNQVSADSCTTACKIARCGDMIVQSNEQCDDGNQVNGDFCTNICRFPTCGDGVIQLGEQCDDGNTVEIDACTNQCAFARCGDMVVQLNEECDDGNKVNGDGCSNLCKLPFCGNGIREGQELCDDGNQSNNDSCTNECKRPVCGDGFVQVGEFCDDANQSNDDTCTIACRAPICGDGLLHPREDCDDGRKNSDAKADACRMDCRLPRCGDNVKDADEQCDGEENCDSDCRLLKGAAAADASAMRGIFGVGLALFGIASVLAFIFRKKLHSLIAKAAGEEIARSIDDIPLDEIEMPWQRMK